MKEENDNGVLFIQLIKQHVQVAKISLGLEPNSISGKFERNLDYAEIAINTLKMIAVKTAGNLSTYEEKFLKQSVNELDNLYISEKLKNGSDKT